MIPRYRDYIFDLDGTLTRPGLIDFPAIKRAIGCPLRDTIIEFLTNLHGAELRQAWRIIDAHEQAALTRVKPNDGAYVVLDALHLRGARCFILTRNSRHATRTTLRVLGIRRYVADTICREDAAPKPDPAGIHTLQKRWCLDPRRTLMVGDFHFDVLTGAAAGLDTAFLTNRAEPQQDVAFPVGHPTHVIRDLRALLRLF